MAQRDSFERILRLAAFVGARRTTGCTIRDIAANVPGFQHQGGGALERALKRDITELARSTGIVIKWSDERQRYLIQPPLFDAKERQALLTAAGVVEIDGVGDDLPLGELGAAIDTDLAQVVVRVHHLVVTLRDAIAARRTISFDYQGTAGATSTRRIDPYAVGLWRNRWYVTGHDHDRDGRRAFRLDRIVTTGDGSPSIELIGEPGSFDIPGDADLAGALRMDPNAWGTDPPLAALVRVRHDHLPAFLSEFAADVTSRDADSATCSLEVRDNESFVIRLLGFGTGVDLLDPPELCGRLRHWLAGQADG